MQHRRRQLHRTSLFLELLTHLHQDAGDRADDVDTIPQRRLKAGGNPLLEGQVLATVLRWHGLKGEVLRERIEEAAGGVRRGRQHEQELEARTEVDPPLFSRAGKGQRREARLVDAFHELSAVWEPLETAHPARRMAP
jgi:hypothetical protein